MRAKKPPANGVRRIAHTKDEAFEFVPWGRNQFEFDLAEGICPSFKRGRRVFITDEQLREYLANVMETA